MTREEASNICQIIKAYGEGKTIQYKARDTGEWCDWKDCLCYDCTFYNDVEYRIKPELTEIKPITTEDLREDKDISHKLRDTVQSMKIYRPFTDTAELMVHYSNHFNVEYPPFYEPLIWVKRKQTSEQSPDTRLFITGYDELCVFLEDIWIDLGELFEQYVFLDDSCCGKVVK